MNGEQGSAVESNDIELQTTPVAVKRTGASLIVSRSKAQRQMLGQTSRAPSTVKIAVRGNSATDNTAPTFSSATLDGTSLVITFDEDLAAAANLANSAFTVKKTPGGQPEETVSLTGSPSINGATVTLTLATAAVSTDTDIKVSYDKPTTGTDNKLIDAADNEVASFTDQPVTNNSNAAATGAPTISGAPQSGETLTAEMGTIADADGLPTTFPDDYTLQWIRVDADGSSNPVNIGTGMQTYDARRRGRWQADLAQRDVRRRRRHDRDADVRRLPVPWLSVAENRRDKDCLPDR